MVCPECTEFLCRVGRGVDRRVLLGVVSSVNFRPVHLIRRSPSVLGGSFDRFPAACSIAESRSTVVVSQSHPGDVRAGETRSAQPSSTMSIIMCIPPGYRPLLRTY